MLACTLSFQSRPPLCDPMDCSPPGSPSRAAPGKSTGVGCQALLRRNYIVTAKLNERKERRKKRRNGMREEGKAN